MLKMEPFIDSFVEGLGLDHGYTMIVVNPKWSANLASYGFRAGFSIDEMTMLQSQASRGTRGGGRRLIAGGCLWGRGVLGRGLRCGGVVVHGSWATWLH